MPLAVDIGELQLGGRYITATCGPCEATKYCSVFPRGRRAEREGYCSANINASGRVEDIGGGGLEEGRVMPREQLPPDTPVAYGLGVDSNVCTVEVETC